MESFPWLLINSDFWVKSGGKATPSHSQSFFNRKRKHQSDPPPVSEKQRKSDDQSALGPEDVEDAETVHVEDTYVELDVSLQPEEEIETAEEAKLLNPLTSPQCYQNLWIL